MLLSFALMLVERCDEVSTQMIYNTGSLAQQSTRCENGSVPTFHNRSVRTNLYKFNRLYAFDMPIGHNGLKGVKIRVDVPITFYEQVRAT